MPETLGQGTKKAALSAAFLWTARPEKSPGLRYLRSLRYSPVPGLIHQAHQR